VSPDADSFDVIVDAGGSGSGGGGSGASAALPSLLSLLLGVVLVAVLA
jgi:hypothetical protein